MNSSQDLRHMITSRLEYLTEFSFDTCKIEYRLFFLGAMESKLLENSVGWMTVDLMHHVEEHVHDCEVHLGFFVRQSLQVTGILGTRDCSSGCDDFRCVKVHHNFQIVVTAQHSVGSNQLHLK
jgi:hypothetical protein